MRGLALRSLSAPRVFFPPSTPYCFRYRARSLSLPMPLHLAIARARFGRSLGVCPPACRYSCVALVPDDRHRSLARGGDRHRLYLTRSPPRIRVRIRVGLKSPVSTHCRRTYGASPVSSLMYCKNGVSCVSDIPHYRKGGSMDEKGGRDGSHSIILQYGYTVLRSRVWNTIVYQASLFPHRERGGLPHAVWHQLTAGGRPTSVGKGPALIV
jgi:hypothetical protein